MMTHNVMDVTEALPWIEVLLAQRLDQIDNQADDIEIYDIDKLKKEGGGINVRRNKKRQNRRDHR